MGDEITKQLAELPPHLWAESLRRMEVVDRYLALDNPTAADADRSAAELKLVQRSFFRLAAAVRELRAGGEPKVSLQGQQSSLAATTRSVLESTILELGPGARDSEIFVECRRRCEEQKLASPSWNAVRTRTGKPAFSRDLRGRMQRDADFVLDSCPLDLTVHAIASSPQLAVLTALIHVDTGEILGAHVNEQQVTDSAVANVFLEAIDHPTIGPAAATKSRRRLIVCTAIEPLMPAVETLAEAAKLHIDKDQSLGLRPGVALTNAVGRKVGRIPFRPGGRAVARPDLSVPLPYAHAVVGELLARRSRALAEQRGNLVEGWVGPKSARLVRSAALSVVQDGS